MREVRVGRAQLQELGRYSIKRRANHPLKHQSKSTNVMPHRRQASPRPTQHQNEPNTTQRPTYWTYLFLLASITIGNQILSTLYTYNYSAIQPFFSISLSSYSEDFLPHHPSGSRVSRPLSVIAKDVPHYFSSWTYWNPSQNVLSTSIYLAMMLEH